MEGARSILRTERQLAKREHLENEEEWKEVRLGRLPELPHINRKSSVFAA